MNLVALYIKVGKTVVCLDGPLHLPLSQVYLGKPVERAKVARVAHGQVSIGCLGFLPLPQAEQALCPVAEDGAVGRKLSQGAVVFLERPIPLICPRMVVGTLHRGIENSLVSCHNAIAPSHLNSWKMPEDAARPKLATSNRVYHEKMG